MINVYEPGTIAACKITGVVPGTNQTEIGFHAKGKGEDE